MKDTNLSEDKEDQEQSLAKSRGPNRPTRELIKQFSALVEDGLPFDVACDFLGISSQSFWSWIRKGKFFNQSPESEPKYKVYGDFEQAVKKSAAVYYHKLVNRLHDPKNLKWQRDLAILERRDRKNFAKYDLLSGGASQQLEELDPDSRYA